MRREDRQRVQSAVEAERAGSRVAIEFRVKGARGADRWIEWRSSLLAMPGFEDCVVGVFRDVTATHRAMLELELATDTLRDQALRDPLTLLWNRRGLAEFALRESSRLQRGTGSLSAILIDVDDFKLCNEHLGYAEGDRVLREIAEVISQSVRPSDIVGRVGGDEFLAILPEVGLVEASVIAERVRAAIDARVRRGEHHVTASLGVALVQAGAITVEGLIRSTQGALRQGKSLGKNRVERARLSGTTFLG